MTLNKKWLFFPALALGVLVLVLAVKLKPELPVKPADDRARLVETLPLELKAVAPLAIGFGKVAPKVEWKAIAEVSGKVIYRHPRLEKGQVLKAGTEIFASTRSITNSNWCKLKPTSNLPKPLWLSSIKKNKTSKAV